MVRCDAVGSVDRVRVDEFVVADGLEAFKFGDGNVAREGKMLSLLMSGMTACVAKVLVKVRSVVMVNDHVALRRNRYSLS